MPFILGNLRPDIIVKLDDGPVAECGHHGIQVVGAKTEQVGVTARLPRTVDYFAA